MPGERVSYEARLALWRAAGDRSQNPAFGLYVAEHATDASTFGAVGFLARHSATVGEALANAVRYASLVRDETQLRLETAGGAPAVVFRL